MLADRIKINCKEITAVKVKNRKNEQITLKSLQKAVTLIRVREGIAKMDR